LTMFFLRLSCLASLSIVLTFTKVTSTAAASVIPEPTLASNVLDRNGCTIDLRQDSNLPEIAPLLTTYHQDWILPSSDAKITLESESTMRISCPGIGFQHEDLSAKQFWTTKCMSGSEFQIDELGKSFNYKDLGCSDWPIETVEPKGSCGPNNEAVVIEISFAVSQSSNKVLIASCLDMTTYQSLWSRHVIPKQIDQRNTGGNMPYFTDDGLYGFLWETYTYYTKNIQRETIGVLVGSEDLANQYVEDSGDVYMARGHLAPKADFMYTTWQRATYHYVNVQPQWQVFNAGNWVYIEEGIRDFVVSKSKDILVYTGSHGVMELDNVEGKKVPIHLNLDMSEMTRLPAPRLYWKMVVDESENLGVVLIGVNNPHLAEEEVDQYRICQALDHHPLLDNVYHPQDIRRGVVYACSVPDARNVISEIPTDVVINGVLE